MSGGSYEYICNRDSQELAESYGDPLTNMLERLLGLGYANDAATETQGVIDDLAELRALMARIDRRMRPVQQVWRAMEWWDSMDSSEEGFRRALEEWRLARQPKHVIEQRGNRAHCTHCDNEMGWHCSESPDGVCHTFCTDGKIVLLNGDKVDPKPGTDTDADFGECLFCGKSEEDR
ncbi:MAG: hypothetical protein K2W95_36655 [Candidatus Obscuribacterales bacterium]|nr:hypothetical protein [Candidatus Obscuribacterales bacterium]